MTTYTIIWQNEGEYLWDRDDEVGGNKREELHIETFMEIVSTNPCDDMYVNPRGAALSRFAELTYDGEEKAMLTLLLDGTPYDSPAISDAEKDAIKAELKPLDEAAKAKLEAAKAAERERLAQAAAREAQRLQELQRRQDLAHLEVLQRRLGIIK